MGKNLHKRAQHVEKVLQAEYSSRGVKNRTAQHGDMDKEILVYPLPSYPPYLFYSSPFFASLISNSNLPSALSPPSPSPFSFFIAHLEMAKAKQTRRR